MAIMLFEVYRKSKDIFKSLPLGPRGRWPNGHFVLVIPLILYLVAPPVRKAFKTINASIRRRVLVFIAVNEAIFLVSRLLSYLAISKGPVALVDVVGGTQVFIAIVYGFVLTLLAPRIFKEDITRGGLAKKLSMAVLVLFGLWLVKG